MLNKLWGLMIVAGICVAAFTGRIGTVSTSVIDSAREAVTLCITMMGIMALWTGIMNIAKKAGIIDAMTRMMTPVLTFLFPDIPKGHVANEYIAANMISNMLGLSWAATPAGLKAMEEMKKLNNGSRTASTDMCTFLIIHLISFLSFSIVGYLRMDISMLEIMQLALIPLFLAHGCMLFFLNRIKRLYTAFISYIILFLFFSNFFHPILINSSALQLGWIQTLIVSLFSTVLFLIAAYRYGLKLQRRIHYGA